MGIYTTLIYNKPLRAFYSVIGAYNTGHTVGKNYKKSASRYCHGIILKVFILAF